MSEDAAAAGGPALVLVGPPGAEVVPVAAEVAGRLGAPLLNTDAAVAATTGRDVAELFVDEGEEAFRVRERAAVERALATPGAVVALGTGAVLDAGTRSALEAQRRAGVPVVYLEVSLAQAVPRMGFNLPRPPGLNPRQVWADLMEARRPLYEQVSSHQVSTDGLTPAEVAAEVLGATGLTAEGER